MTTWSLTKETYWNKKSAVYRICTDLFGKENDRIHDHGRWQMDGGHVAFRYEKDLTWFLLKAENMNDFRPGWVEI